MVKICWSNRGGQSALARAPSRRTPRRAPHLVRLTCTHEKAASYRRHHTVFDHYRALPAPGPAPGTPRRQYRAVFDHTGQKRSAGGIIQYLTTIARSPRRAPHLVRLAGRYAWQADRQYRAVFDHTGQKRSAGGIIKYLTTVARTPRRAPHLVRLAGDVGGGVLLAANILHHQDLTSTLTSVRAVL